jgi:hypothetical protein
MMARDEKLYNVVETRAYLAGRKSMRDELEAANKRVDRAEYLAGKALDTGLFYQQRYKKAEQKVERLEANLKEMEELRKQVEKLEDIIKRAIGRPMSKESRDKIFKEMYEVL